MKVIQVAQGHVGLGWSAETIHENDPALSLGQIHSALAWFFDHQEEMGREMNLRAGNVRRIAASLAENAVQRRFQELKAAAAL